MNKERPISANSREELAALISREAGKPEAEATQALTNAGFEVTSTQEKNDKVPEGIVVSVDPGEGTSVQVERRSTSVAPDEGPSGPTKSLKRFRSLPFES